MSIVHSKVRSSFFLSFRLCKAPGVKNPFNNWCGGIETWALWESNIPLHWCLGTLHPVHFLVQWSCSLTSLCPSLFSLTPHLQILPLWRTEATSLGIHEVLLSDLHLIHTLHWVRNTMLTTPMAPCSTAVHNMSSHVAPKAILNLWMVSAVCSDQVIAPWRLVWLVFWIHSYSGSLTPGILIPPCWVIRHGEVQNAVKWAAVPHACNSSYWEAKKRVVSVRPV